MTTSAIAIARESLALVGYRCGSAFGSVTTLSTFARLPPIWAAMLPQKFSAATTLRTEPPEPLDDPVPLHAARNASAAAAATIHGLTATVLHKLLAQVGCASWRVDSCCAPSQPGDRRGPSDPGGGGPARVGPRRAPRGRAPPAPRRRFLDSVSRDAHPRAGGRRRPGRPGRRQGALRDAPRPP